MSPEDAEVWTPFKERVSALVDDITWSEFDRERTFLINDFVRFVEITAVIRGTTHKWHTSKDEAAFEVTTTLANWLAGIEWQIRRFGAGLPVMVVGGHCPVQGYEIRDGWLFYFRARDGWALSAWPPGTWEQEQEQSCAQTALDTVTDFFNPPVLVDESGDGFPAAHELESDHPGWWSWEYATLVAEWAIAKAMATAVAGRA